jgi:hypothetical protein
MLGTDHHYGQEVLITGNHAQGMFLAGLAIHLRDMGQFNWQRLAEEMCDQNNNIP